MACGRGVGCTLFTSTRRPAPGGLERARGPDPGVCRLGAPYLRLGCARGQRPMASDLGAEGCQMEGASRALVGCQAWDASPGLVQVLYAYSGPGTAGSGAEREGRGGGEEGTG